MKGQHLCFLEGERGCKHFTDKAGEAGPACLKQSFSPVFELIFIVFVFLLPTAPPSPNVTF